MDEWNLLDLSYLVLSYDAAAGAGGSTIVTSSSAASSAAATASVYLVLA
jgi:hypothetical protein